MNQSTENLCFVSIHRRSNRPRRGMYMLELVLILPLILLILTILYQVSVMMTTYQILRLTAFNASRAFAQTVVSGTEIKTQVESAIQVSIQNYYLGKRAFTFVPAVTNNTWKTVSSGYAVKYRLMTYDESGATPTWQYYDGSSASPIADGTLIAVEMKLENADDVFPNYWLLARFTGVNAVKSEAMVLSQVAVKKNP